MKTLRCLLLLGILWPVAAQPLPGQDQLKTEKPQAPTKPTIVLPSPGLPPQTQAPPVIPVDPGIAANPGGQGQTGFGPGPGGPGSGGSGGDPSRGNLEIMRKLEQMRERSLPVVLPITVDPKTPVKDLLPSAPKSTRRSGPLLGDDLSKVPEVDLGAAVKKDDDPNAGQQLMALQIARINHLNSKKQDGFLDALLAERRDLRGLPFAMGDACRTRGERSKQFNTAVALLRISLQPARIEVGTPPQNPPAIVAFGSDQFWENYRMQCAQQETNNSAPDREKHEHVIQSRIAALMQVLMPESADVRLRLVKYLATISHVEATRNLARLAIFSEEEEVRNAAVDALRVRRERDYTEVLTQGLRYPWPTVARRTAEVVVKLERQDLIPQLLEVLENDDPRAPQTKMVDGKQTLVARELVKLNHHRNCLMCHSPGNDGKVAADTLTAGVPIPGESMSPPSQGYQNSNPNILVRIDVTYLRQDFSRMQAVADAAPWPEMQRFDYLVQTRTLSDEEAASYREKLAAREPGQLSPYHRAALVALRELTGKDTEPNASAWRKLLGKETQTRR